MHMQEMNGHHVQNTEIYITALNDNNSCVKRPELKLNGERIRTVKTVA